MRKSIIKRNNKYLQDYKETKVGNKIYLDLKWTKSVKNAKILDNHNDISNHLKQYPEFIKSCKIIPKWTNFDRYWKIYSIFSKKSDIIQSKESISKEDLKYLRAKWEFLILKITEMWGWNKQTSKDIFENGQNGHNWELLHFPYKTDKEPKNPKLDRFRDKDSKQLLKGFLSELDYCSDRMSLDRLLRCHWEFCFFQEIWLRENSLMLDYKNNFVYFDYSKI